MACHLLRIESHTVHRCKPSKSISPEHLSAREIARSRLLIFEVRFEALRARGLARGGILQNAVVLDLRYPQSRGTALGHDSYATKFLDARHLVTLGMPLRDTVVSPPAGHDL